MKGSTHLPRDSQNTDQTDESPKATPAVIAFCTTTGRSSCNPNVMMVMLPPRELSVHYKFLTLQQAELLAAVNWDEGGGGGMSPAANAADGMKPPLSDSNPPFSLPSAASSAAPSASVPAMYEIVSGSSESAQGLSDISSPVPYMTPMVTGLTWVS